MVEDTIERLGGLVKAAAAGDTTPNTLYTRLREGHVRQARTVLLWAEALEPKDCAARWQLARRLAGLS